MDVPDIAQVDGRIEDGTAKWNTDDVPGEWTDGISTADVEGYGVDGIGVGALHALYAAAADRRFRSLRLEDVPYSFHGIATTEEYDVDFRLRVHGLVGTCDLPQVLPALDDRDVEWVGTDPSRFR